MSTSIFSSSPDTLGYVFTLLLVAGGLLGFIRRGSRASLIASSICASGQVYGSRALAADPTNFFPVMLVNSLLFLMMAYKFFKSNKFMPSGLIMSLTCVNLARYGTNMAPPA